MSYDTLTLANGIRIIHEQNQSKLGHFALMINTGSRDERENELGIAHFIEHVLFKGTSRRKSYHIISRLEDVGGDLNAYTTKEETCIHAAFLAQYYERAIELIYDITFCSIFPEHELEKEKEVILDEINSYKDSPSEYIFDEFDEQLFPNNPMGNNILGTPESLQKIHRDDVFRFIKNNYHTDQIVLCSVGNISTKKLLRIIEKYFTQIPANTRQEHRIPANNYRVSKHEIEKKTFQSHCVLGGMAYGLYHPQRLGLVLLNNILGGNSMNSRLNLSLREKFGLVYNVDSSYYPYTDSGIHTIYFGTDSESMEKSIELVYKELKKLREQKLGILQLQKAKLQLIGQMAINSENYENLLLSMAKSYLFFNKFDSMAEAISKIGNITATELWDIANDIYDESKLSMLIYR